RVAAVGVHDKRIGAGDGLAGPGGGVARVRQVLDLLRGGDADRGVIAGGGVGLRSDDSAAAPAAAVAAGLDQACDACVAASGERADGGFGDEVIVGEVQLGAGGDGEGGEPAGSGGGAVGQDGDRPPADDQPAR